MLDRSELGKSVPGNGDGSRAVRSSGGRPERSGELRAGAPARLYTASLALAAASPISGVFLCHVQTAAGEPGDARRQGATGAGAGERRD